MDSKTEVSIINHTIFQDGIKYECELYDIRSMDINNQIAELKRVLKEIKLSGTPSTITTRLSDFMKGTFGLSNIIPGVLTFDQLKDITDDITINARVHHGFKNGKRILISWKLIFEIINTLDYLQKLKFIRKIKNSTIINYNVKFVELDESTKELRVSLDGDYDKWIKDHTEGSNSRKDCEKRILDELFYIMENESYGPVGRTVSIKKGSILLIIGGLLFATAYTEIRLQNHFLAAAIIAGGSGALIGSSFGPIGVGVGSSIGAGIGIFATWFQRNKRIIITREQNGSWKIEIVDI